MNNTRIELYPEAKTALFVLFVTNFSQMMRGLNTFGKEHLLFLKEQGLINSTMEVVTKKGLTYIAEIKKN